MVDNSKTPSFFESSLANPKGELYVMVIYDDHTRMIEIHKVKCPVFHKLQQEYGEIRKKYMKEKKEPPNPLYRHSIGTLNDLTRNIDDTIKRENYPGWRKTGCCFK